VRLVHRITYQNRLPTSDFDLVNDAGEILGFGQLRHRPSRGADLPDGAESHIHYAIDGPHQRKGHAASARPTAPAQLSMTQSPPRCSPG